MNKIDQEEWNGASNQSKVGKSNNVKNNKQQPNPKKTSSKFSSVP